MYTAIFTTLVVAASLSNAVRVTSPTDDSLWQSGSSQTISWESVSTDPQQFDIQLVNQAGFLTNSPVTLKEDQSTSSQSTTISYPSGNWPEGTAFQINLVAKPNAGNSGFAILAQSGQFNITSGGSNSRSSAAASSSTTTGVAPTTVRQTTTTSNVPATSSGAVVNANSGDASGGIPNSQTQPTGAALANFDAPTGLISLFAVAAGIIGVTI